MFPYGQRGGSGVIQAAFAACIKNTLLLFKIFPQKFPPKMDTQSFWQLKLLQVVASGVSGRDEVWTMRAPFLLFKNAAENAAKMSNL